MSWSVKRFFPCQCIDEELSDSIQEPGLDIIVSGTAQAEGGYDEPDELGSEHSAQGYSFTPGHGDGIHCVGS